MAFLTRDQIKPPVLQRVTEPMPSLGGDVVVRGLMLDQRLALDARLVGLSRPAEGQAEPSPEEMGARAVAELLAATVVLQDDTPLWTAAEWYAHGGAHPQEVLHLYGVAKRLTGGDLEAAEKN